MLVDSHAPFPQAMDEILHSHVIEERAQGLAQAWKDARAEKAQAARAAAAAAGEARLRELQEKKQRQHQQQQEQGTEVGQQQQETPGLEGGNVGEGQERQLTQTKMEGGGETLQQSTRRDPAQHLEPGSTEPIAQSQPERQQQCTQVQAEQVHALQLAPGAFIQGPGTLIQGASLQPEAALPHPAHQAAQFMQAVDLGPHATLSRDPHAPIQIFCTNLTLPPAAPADPGPAGGSSMPTLPMSAPELAPPSQIAQQSETARHTHPPPHNPLAAPPPSLPSPLPLHQAPVLSFHHQDGTSILQQQQQQQMQQDLQDQQQHRRQQLQIMPVQQQLPQGEQQPTEEQLAQELAALILQACREDSSLAGLLQSNAHDPASLNTYEQQPPQSASLHPPSQRLARSVRLATLHHTPSDPATARRTLQPGSGGALSGLQCPSRPAYLAGSGLPPRAPPAAPILPVGPGACVRVHLDSNSASFLCPFSSALMEELPPSLHFVAPQWMQQCAEAVQRMQLC